MVRGDGAAGVFFGGVAGFVEEDTFFGGAAAWPFLAFTFFDTIAFGAGALLFLGVDFVEQDLAGEETVEALLAGDLTFYFEPCGPMGQHDAGCGLVDVLTAVAAGADEALVEIIFVDAQDRHAPMEFGCFLRTDGKGAHGGNVREAGGRCERGVRR
jgi:hypothetical protein